MAMDKETAVELISIKKDLDVLRRDHNNVDYRLTLAVETMTTAVLGLRSDFKTIKWVILAGAIGVGIGAGILNYEGILKLVF